MKLKIGDIISFMETECSDDEDSTINPKWKGIKIRVMTTLDEDNNFNGLLLEDVDRKNKKGKIVHLYYDENELEIIQSGWKSNLPRWW